MSDSGCVDRRPRPTFHNIPGASPGKDFPPGWLPLVRAYFLLRRESKPIDPRLEAVWGTFQSSFEPILRAAVRLDRRAGAEDRLQDAWAMLVRVLPDFHQDVSRGMLANWLYTVAHNAALNAARRSRRHPETILPERAVEAVPSHGLNPSLEAEIGEFWDRIRSSLSPDELELLDAHFLHGCQPKEIVAARRLAPSTVYRHLTSLRHKIIAIIDSLSESDTVP